MKKFDEWGLKNIQIERFSIHMTAPQTAALVGQPRPKVTSPTRW